MITIKAKKTGKLIRIPLHPDLQEALSSLPQKGDFVFTTGTGKAMRPRLLDRYLRRV